MPFTPFIGLSVLVHIGIIVGYRLSHWKSGEKIKVKTPTLNSVRWSGFAIILAVFLVVLANAALLVRHSVEDKHSSIHFIYSHSKELAWFFYPHPISVTVNSAAGVEPVTASARPAVSLAVCSKLIYGPVKPVKAGVIFSSDNFIFGKIEAKSAVSKAPLC